MHGEIAANAVAGAVLEVEPHLPEKLPRKGIDLRAAHAIGEHSLRDGDMAPQNAGETACDFSLDAARDTRPGRPEPRQPEPPASAVMWRRSAQMEP